MNKTIENIFNSLKDETIENMFRELGIKPYKFVALLRYRIKTTDIVILMLLIGMIRAKQHLRMMRFFTFRLFN